MRLDAPPPEALVHQETVAAITLGGRVLASGIPVVAGRVAIQADQDVPQTVDLTLPHEWEQYVLDPTRPGAVLGHYGHRIHLTTTLTEGARSWALPMSQYLVQDWDLDGAGVRVRAAGLLALTRGHQAAVPQPVGSRSLAVSVLAQILREDRLDTIVEPGLPRTQVGAEFVIDADRFATAQTLAAAIPAVIRQDWDGAIHIRPVPSDSFTPVLEWTDGVDGTVVTPARSGSRDGLFSEVIVHWTAGEGDDETSGYVQRQITTGALAPGAFGTVTRRIESDAISSHPQAQLIAANEIARAHLRARTEEVTMAADFRAELDDPVALTVAGETVVGRVTGIEYPLTPDDGDMALTVGVPA